MFLHEIVEILHRLCTWSYFSSEVVSNVSLAEVMGCADTGPPTSGCSRSVDMKRVLNRNLLLIRAFGCFAILKPQVDSHYGVRFTTVSLREVFPG